MVRGSFGTEGPSPARRTVLLAEDEPDVRNLFAILLRDAGYDVLLAADGKEALDLWENEESPRPALIFADWCMPRLNGLELARHIRADPVAGDVPFVLYTAYHPPAAEELAELQVHYRSKSDRWSSIAPLVKQLAG